MHKLNLKCTSFDIYSMCVKILCMCMQQRTYLSFRCHVRATLKVADFSSLLPGGHCQQSNAYSVTSDSKVNIAQVCRLNYICQANMRPTSWS